MKLFYALTFSQASKDKLYKISQAIKPLTERGSMTHRENFHLTLEFIGQVNKDQVKDYSDIIKHLELQLSHLTVKEVSTFKKKNRYVLWLGVEEKDSLNHLNKQLRRHLELKGLKKEFIPNVPHITLARNTIIKDEIKIDPISIEIESIALMISHRVKDKLVYEPLQYNVNNNRP